MLKFAHFIPEVLISALGLIVLLTATVSNSLRIIKVVSLLGMLGVIINIYHYHDLIISTINYDIQGSLNTHNMLFLKQIVVIFALMIIFTFFGSIKQSILTQSNHSNLKLVNNTTDATKRNTNVLGSINNIYNENISYLCEYIILILFSCLGAFVVISSTDLLTMFVGLELQAFCGYIVAAFHSRCKLVNEAGVKYFIIGCVASCFALLGISILYGLTSSIEFSVISHKINQIHTYYNQLGTIDDSKHLLLLYYLSIVLISINLLFKISSSPFQGAILDVYQAPPLFMVSFISTIHKIGAIAALINIVNSILIKLNIGYGLFETIACISLIVGSLGGVNQKSIKRILGYSSVLNSGFILMAILNTKGYDNKLLLYITVYFLNLIGLFGALALIQKKCINSIHKNHSLIKIKTLFSHIMINNDLHINDLKYLERSKLLKYSTVLLILSLIGIPPLSGFFIKYYVLEIALYKQQYMFCVCAIISSVVSSYYYLKIILSCITEPNDHTVDVEEFENHATLPPLQAFETIYQPDTDIQNYYLFLVTIVGVVVVIPFYVFI